MLESIDLKTDGEGDLKAFYRALIIQQLPGEVSIALTREFPNETSTYGAVASPAGARALAMALIKAAAAAEAQEERSS